MTSDCDHMYTAEVCVHCGNTVEVGGPAQLRRENERLQELLLMVREFAKHPTWYVDELRNWGESGDETLMRRYASFQNLYKKHREGHS